MALVDERDVRPRTVAGFKNNIKKEKKISALRGIACVWSDGIFIDVLLLLVPHTNLLISNNFIEDYILKYNKINFLL